MILLKDVKKILCSCKQELLQRGVRSLAVFGSVSRNEANAKSDIDILIGFDAEKGLFALVDLKSYLESLLKCKVDLVTKGSLHPALKKKILKEAKRLF